VNDRTNPSAFVLMPFGDDWDEIYRGLFASPLQEAGYAVARADSFLTHRNVLRDIIRGIADADLIVAELSVPNPNVLYELGVAQGLGKATVLVAQDLDEVPFDLRSYRIELYSTTFTEVEDFRERLKKIGLDHLGGHLEFGSPVSDFAGMDFQDDAGGDKRIDAEIAEWQQASNESSTDSPSEEGPAGFLDNTILLEDATAAMEAFFVEVTDDLGVLADATSKKAAEIRFMAEGGRPANPRELLRLTTAMANDLTAFAGSIDRRLPGMEARTQELIGAGSGLANWLAEGVDDNRDQVVDFRGSMAELIDASAASGTQLTEMAGSTKSVRGATRELDRASGEVEASIHRLVDLISQIEAFATRAELLASEALEAA
jgi:hypothetical protein